MRLPTALHEGVQLQQGKQALHGSAAVSFADKHDNISKKFKHEHVQDDSSPHYQPVPSGGDQEDGFPRLRIISCAVHMHQLLRFPWGQETPPGSVLMGDCMCTLSWLNPKPCQPKHSGPLLAFGQVLENTAERSM